jgi:hypothetical protein
MTMCRDGGFGRRLLLVAGNTSRHAPYNHQHYAQCIVPGIRSRTYIGQANQIRFAQHESLTGSIREAVLLA